MKTTNDADRGGEQGVMGSDWARQAWPDCLHANAGDSAPSETTAKFPEPTLLRLFDELAFGLIMIDAARQVTHINRAGRGVLAREQRLRVHGRALDTWHQRDAGVFADALNKAFQGKRTLVNLGEAHGSIMLVPLPVALAPTVTAKQGQAECVCHIALVFERSSCSESLAIAFFAQSHGLTCGEERVLRTLSDNQSINEAAEALRTAVSTIRTHVSHIREKTGARSLRALMASVKSVPASMPALGE